MAMRWVSIAVIICLTHNSVAAFYLAVGVMFFSPFAVYADAFQQEAHKGQQLGQTLKSEFVLPEVDAATGTMSLKNGAVAGQTVQQSELFQQVVPGSMDAAVAALGDNSAMSNHVNGAIDELTTSGTGHGMAYQTLIGANTALPNLASDPIWQRSDDVLGQKTSEINDNFTGCQHDTTFTEQDCSIHLKKLRTCKKTAKTRFCRVTRTITYDPVFGTASGDGRVVSCGPGCTYLYIGQVGDNYWYADGCKEFTWTARFIVARPNAIKKVLIDHVQYDDQTQIALNASKVFTGKSGYTGNCELNTSWNEHPAQNITKVFKNAAKSGLVTMTQTTRVGGNGEGFARLKVLAALDITEQFTDIPVGCRERVFNAWADKGEPLAWTRTESLNDLASTDWWQCTDAAYERQFGGYQVSTSNPQSFAELGDILPEPMSSPPAPICYQAKTRLPGHVKLACFTDLHGYEQCPEFDYDTHAHDTCDSFETNPACGYVGEHCADGAISPITGTCQEFIVTYDCGREVTKSCDLVKTADKTICDSKIRCIGGECVGPVEESNADFVRAAAALQTLNQAQQSNGCDIKTGTCQLFKGEALSCQMADVSVLGKVDCCNMPIEGSWIDYIELGYKSWLLTDTSVEAYAVAEYGQQAVSQSGAWTLVTKGTAFADSFTTVKEAYSAITEPFTSAYDSVVSMLGEELGVNLQIEVIKQQAMQYVADWIAETFGQQAAEAIFSYGSSGAVSGLSSTLSSVFTVIGIVYAIYTIAKMVVQMIFACTADEAKLNMLKDQRLCTQPDAIGTYCSAKFLGSCIARREAYCCFSSAFSRIFQEQARAQLGIPYGDPKRPQCEGLTLNQINALDFEQMDLSEWIGMLQVSGHLPSSGASADALYEQSVLTNSQLNGANNNNAEQRLDKQTQGTDTDAIRQHLLDNL